MLKNLSIFEFLDDSARADFSTTILAPTGVSSNYCKTSALFVHNTFGPPTIESRPPLGHTYPVKPTESNHNCVKLPSSYNDVHDSCSSSVKVRLFNASHKNDLHLASLLERVPPGQVPSFTFRTLRFTHWRTLLPIWQPCVRLVARVE